MAATKPAWVDALAELEAYAKERGWNWTAEGHAGVIRRLMRAFDPVGFTFEGLNMDELHMAISTANYANPDWLGTYRARREQRIKGA